MVLCCNIGQRCNCFKFCLIINVLVKSLFNSIVDIFILLIYQFCPTFSWDFPFYIIALWVIPLLFFFDSPLVYFPKAALVANNVKYLQRNFLQNPIDSATIVFRLLRNFIRFIDYLLLLSAMISLVPNSIDLTWYWLNQWTNKRICFFILPLLSEVPSTESSFQSSKSQLFCNSTQHWLYKRWMCNDI